MHHVEITVPASKSLSHRALICAGLAEGVSPVENVLESDDLARTRACLEALGVCFEPMAENLTVHGVGGRFAAEQAQLDVGESGTTCRLMTAVAAAGSGSFTLAGQGRMHQRPILPLAVALQQLGCGFEWLQKEGFLPCRLHTHGLRGGRTAINLEDSSQFLSGLLLAAPLAADPVQIEITGSRTVSWPYVALTLEVMRDFGHEPVLEQSTAQGWQPVAIDDNPRVIPGQSRFRCQPGAYVPRAYRVEGDWSNASYFVAAGAIGPQAVRLSGLYPESRQGDRFIAEIVKQFGAHVQWGRDRLVVAPGELHGQELDMGHCPDLVPTVAVLASLAQGRTVLTNIAHLQHKESDRLNAVANELRKVGAEVEVGPDTLHITARPLPRKPLRLSTYDDHRMAMALSLYQLAGVHIQLDNPDCVAKSFPLFWQHWDRVRRSIVQ